jgi:hypothetical protein
MKSKNPILDSQIEELKQEREYSIHKWGGEDGKYIKANDDLQGQNDWISYLCNYASRNYADPEKWRRDLIKVANIALAAASSYDRKAE